MNLKRILLALTAVAMFAAVMANSASAAMKAETEWYTGSPTVTLPEGSSKTVKCSIGGTGVFTLEGSVGESKTPVKLTATGIECIGATIFNEGGHGRDKGKLKFTGVTVDEPLHCSVEGGTVETNELSTELFVEEGVTTKVFDKFVPTAGSTANFATVKLTGAECSVLGSKLVKGFVYGEAEREKGVANATQPLKFSSTIDTTTAGALTFASNPAHLTGTVINELSPSLVFGSK